MSATASDGADHEVAADVRRFLESRGALGVFATLVGGGILRVVFRWRAATRERAERDAAELVSAALGSERRHADVRTIAR